MRSRLLLTATLTLVLQSCATAPAPGMTTRLSEVIEPADSNGVFVLADPQLHNVYGGSVKQMLAGADLFSKVAIRPPELNLIAPLVLEELLREGQAQFTTPNDVIVILGDTTNIGCSSEWDLLDDTFKRGAPGALWLVAHGNHDSYLMGTANHYSPGEGSTFGAPGTPAEPRMVTALRPPDEHWWDEIPAPVDDDWASGCFRHKVAGAQASTPLNKVRWLAKYIGHLERHGLNLSLAPDSSTRVVPVKASVKAGSRLAAINYRVQGKWYRPQRDERTREWFFPDIWASYIVQAFDPTPTHTFVLIDTSRCITRGGADFKSTNAGAHACIGGDQFEAIADILKTAEGRQVVFAGHFPLSHLDPRERYRLVGIMRDRAGVGHWSYLSAHTHARISADDSNLGGRDVNIGSTTDWPMEAHILRFAATSPAVQSTNPLRVPGYSFVDYKRLRFTSRGKTPELCRHLPAAQRLASLTVHHIADRPTFEETKPEKTCVADLRRASRVYLRGTPESDAEYIEAMAAVERHTAALDTARRELERKFREDVAYRRMLLSIAAAAARSEFASWDVIK